jgi:hypothetical protein
VTGRVGGTQSCGSIGCAAKPVPIVQRMAALVVPSVVDRCFPLPGAA